MMRAAFVFVAIAALTITSIPARAASFSIASDARGFVGATTRNGTAATNNYAVGQSSSLSEIRNFFQFSLPTFAGTVTSARLRLDTGRVVINQASPIDYQITSLAELPDSTDDLPLLGTGSLYGARGFTTADSFTFVSIDLNSAGVAALTSGGTFRVSGRVTNATFDAGLPNHLVFGMSPDRQVFLDFDTVVAAVPEPASWAMLITGFGLTGAVMRRRRMAFA
jgi:hypothetical protein